MSLQTARYKILLDAWIRRYQENSKNQRFLLVQFTYWKVFAFPNLKMRVSLEKSYQKTLYHSHFKYLLIALFSSVWYVNTFFMQKTYFIEQKIFYYICIFYIFIYNIYTYIYIYIYIYIHKFTSNCHSKTTPSLERWQLGPRNVFSNLCWQANLQLWHRMLKPPSFPINTRIKGIEP